MSASVSAKMVTVYRAPDGGVHHTRCGRRMGLNGLGGEQLHFSCFTCAESVWLPVCALARIPLAHDGAAGGA